MGDGALPVTVVTDLKTVPGLARSRSPARRRTSAFGRFWTSRRPRDLRGGLAKALGDVDVPYVWRSCRDFAPRFRQTRLAARPLRFARASPPSGCTGDFHPQDAGHARHTGRAHFLASPVSRTYLHARAGKTGAPHPCQNRPASPNLAANLAARDEWQVAMSSGSDGKRKFRNLLPPSGAGIGDAAALGGGMSGSITAHSSSLRSLG